MLSSNIAKLRKQHGLTQIEFAKKLHVTQSAVSHWESGRSMPDTTQLFNIAQLFGMTVDELSSGAHDAVPNEIKSNAPQSQAQEKAPADDPLTEQIMAKARLMNEEELRQLLRIMDAVKK